MSGTYHQRLTFGSRRVWAALTLGLLVLSLLEVWVGHLIVARLLGAPLSTIVDVLLIGATIALTAVVASPLWAARIRLTPDTLVLDLAGLGRATVPLEVVSTVARYEPPLSRAIVPGAVVDGDPPSATFSLGAGDGYVRLTLSQPVPVRHSVWRQAQAEELIVRLDDPGRAVEAISLATASVRPQAD